MSKSDFKTPTPAQHERHPGPNPPWLPTPPAHCPCPFHTAHRETGNTDGIDNPHGDLIGVVDAD